MPPTHPAGQKIGVDVGGNETVTQSSADACPGSPKTNFNLSYNKKPRLKDYNLM